MLLQALFEAIGDNIDPNGALYGKGPQGFRSDDQTSVAEFLARHESTAVHLSAYPKESSNSFLLHSREVQIE